MHPQTTTDCPICKLPAELLLTIFLLALPNNSSNFMVSWGGGTEGQYREDMCARLLLAQVCRHWRLLALEAATLWTVIDEGGGRLRDEFLKRSKEASLRVCIFLDHIARPLTALIPHASRIREMHVIYSGRSPVIRRSQVPRELPLDLSSLRQLTIYTTDHYGHSITKPKTFVSLFPSGLPSLRRLVILNHPWFPAAGYQFLTHLLIREGVLQTGPETVVHVLRQCPSLECLVLLDFQRMWAFIDFDSESEVQLPHLKTFTVHACDQVLWGRLYNCLSLPAIQTLCVVNTYEVSVRHPDRFHPGLSHFRRSALATIVSHIDCAYDDGAMARITFTIYDESFTLVYRLVKWRFPFHYMGEDTQDPALTRVERLHGRVPELVIHVSGSADMPQPPMKMERYGEQTVDRWYYWST